MQESAPHSSWSTTALVISPVSLAKGGQSEELVMPPLPPVQQKRGEELVCGSVSVPMYRVMDRQNRLPGSVWSEGGEEGGEKGVEEGGGGSGQRGLPSKVTASSEPHLEVT